MEKILVCFFKRKYTKFATIFPCDQPNNSAKTKNYAKTKN